MSVELFMGGLAYAAAAFVTLAQECDRVSFPEAAILAIIWPAVGFVRLCFRSGFRIGQELEKHVLPVIRRYGEGE